MISKRTKITLGSLALIIPLFYLLSSNMLARDTGLFVSTVRLVEEFPYNPRPIATDTIDVTGVSESDTRILFLQDFERVEGIPAPANGKTFASSVPGNAPDIRLTGYLYIQKDSRGNPREDRPGIILTHGGTGKNSFATHLNYLVHIANVLVANGYHVLAVDRRDGLLTRCAYEVGTLVPDPTRSQPWKSNTPNEEYCGYLPLEFRDPSFTPNSLETGHAVFGAGDILAAAQFLQQETGTTVIGAHSGSGGGFAVIRAAAIQDDPDTDFASTPGLLDAILVLSPIGHRNTWDLAHSRRNFNCRIVDHAQAYSTIKGSGIRNFDDPEGATEDMYALLNGAKHIEEVEIPTLIVYALTDNQRFIDTALGYQSRTMTMKRAHTLLIARTGHFHEIWQSDPYWVDNMVLTYFKQLLDPYNLDIGDVSGSTSLGPNLDNPLLVHLKLPAHEAASLLAEGEESIVPYLVGPKGACVITP